MHKKLVHCSNVILLSLLGVLTVHVAAQTINPNTGFPGGNAGSLPVQFGVVNTSNGNLLLTIPLASYPQKHGPPTMVNLIYNSNFWTLKTEMGNSSDGYKYAWPSDPSFPDVRYFGLRLNADADDQAQLSLSEVVTPCSSDGVWVEYKDFVLYDPYGGGVPFGGSLSTPCITSGIPVTPQDIHYTARHFNGPIYTLHIASDTIGQILGLEAFDQSGQLIAGGYNGRRDTNGNYYAAPTDQYRRTLVSSRTCDNPLWESQGGLCTFSILSNNGPQTYTIQYTLSPVCTDFTYYQNSQGISQYCGNLVLPTLMTQPDGLSYKFVWDTGSTPGHYGTLTDMYLPSGEHLHYTYSINSAPEAPVAIASISDGHGTTTFSYAFNVGATSTLPAGEFQTTIASPLRYDADKKSMVSDKIVHLYDYVGTIVPAAGGFGACGGFACALPILAATQDPIETRTFNWNIPTSTTTICCNVEFIDDTTVRSVTSSLTGTTYYQNQPNTNLPMLMRENVGNTDERTTVITYSSQYNNSQHIYDLAQSVSIYHGSATSGTPVSYTQYAYDEYSAGYCKNGVAGLTLVSGAAGHDDSYGIAYTTRGNVTSISKLIGNNKYASSHYCYDTLGNVTQSIDPNGNATTYDYTDSWYDTNCQVSNTYSVPTTTTNAVGQVTKRSYWSCTSLPAQIRDPNDLASSRNGETFSYDFLGRSTNTTYPSGVWKAITYTDGPNGKILEEMCCLSTSSTSVSKLTLLDDLGRPRQTQILSDPQGILYQDTEYDEKGNITSTSNPYYSVADSTYGITTYVYDAHRRKRIQTAPDGSVKKWSFQGLYSWYRDENNRSWMNKYDAYNRLVSVTEPGVNGASSTETDYTYDDLNNLTNVHQIGSISDVARDRTFTYDGLSRLITSKNSETGYTNYSYDPNGNLIYKKDARGVESTFSYDGLNRLISKTYSHDPSATPISCYQYDSPAVTNGQGRLANQWTMSPSGTCSATLPSSGYLTLNSILAYNVMGRPTSEQQCTPSNCASNTPYLLSYGYDQIGNLTSYTNGYPIVSQNPLTFIYGYDAVGRLQTVQSNWDILQGSNTESSILHVQSFFPHGVWKNAVYGIGAIYQKRTYNSRLLITGETDTSPSQ